MNKYKLTATILAAHIEADIPNNTTEWIDAISSCVRVMCSYSAKKILDKAAMSLMANAMERIAKMVISPDVSDDADDSSDKARLEEMFGPIVDDFDKYLTLENIILEMEKYLPIYERAVHLLRYDYGDDCIDNLENKMGLSLIQFYVYCLNTFLDNQDDLLTRLFSNKGITIPDNDIGKLMQQASITTKTVMLKKKIDMETECRKMAQEFLKDILD